VGSSAGRWGDALLVSIAVSIGADYPAVGFDGGGGRRRWRRWWAAAVAAAVTAAAVAASAAWAANDFGGLYCRRCHSRRRFLYVSKGET
jgi:hypothetical protein